MLKNTLNSKGIDRQNLMESSRRPEICVGLVRMKLKIIGTLWSSWARLERLNLK